jgi:hypothetical protein
MSKAILEFNLPEEQEEFKDAVNGTKYALALHNIKDDVRSIWKYDELTAQQYEIVDKIYEQINLRLTEANVKND